jgi:hypothetical protein
MRRERKDIRGRAGVSTLSHYGMGQRGGHYFARDVVTMSFKALPIFGLWLHYLIAPFVYSGTPKP